MWHYQVIQYKDYVTLVELITFEGKTGSTEALLVGDDVEDLLHQLKMMAKDIKDYPPIMESDISM